MPKDKLEKSIDKALVFLKNHERVWQAQASRNSAITALTVMAFLSAGHVPGEGRYGPVVEKGIRWVLKRQRANGLIADDGGQEMYQHGISTLMLAEAAGMTDASIGEEIRQAVAKAVSVILKAQRTAGDGRGGWRYRAAHVEGADVSITGWQVMALRAAHNLGCDVPAEAIDLAIDYIKSCHEQPSGGFRYQPTSHVTIGCTGTAILVLEICGKEHHHSQEGLRGGAWLLSKGIQADIPGEAFYYAIYYSSQATFQLGGNYWKVFRPRMHEELLRMQDRSGSWDGRGMDAAQGGRAYCTAMSILALTVEYRFLPIYQRGEDPAEK